MRTRMNNIKIEEFITNTKTRIEKLFQHYIQSASPLLQEVTRYAVFNNGKYIRPSLVYATGIIFNTPYESLDAPATAIELIHTYSLIHDDLPAMDNADLRRGKLSCHKAYSETMAILAGDALQPLAFEILASHASSLSDAQRLAMIKILSQASGANGMVAGQVFDMQPIKNYDSLVKMHHLKTGVMISAAIKLGLAASNNPDTKTETALLAFAQKIGLAFQIQDDLLDIESNTETLGKPQGIDQTNNKITFTSLLGIERAREQAQILFSDVKHELERLGPNAQTLAEITDYIIQRKK